MEPAETVPDDAPTAGRLRGILQADSGTQRGDPARAARALLDVVASDDAPLRLPLGTYAYGVLSDRRVELRRPFESVEDITLGVDFPPGE